MYLLKRLLLIAASLLLVSSLGIAGCKKEGTAERLGKKIDKAVEKAGETFDDLKKKKDE